MTFRPESDMLINPVAVVPSVIRCHGDQMTGMGFSRT